MTDSAVGMVLGCIAVLRDSGMEKAQVIPYYEKLLDHHKITPDDVNKSALMLTLTGQVPSKPIALAHLKELFPELEVKA